jgi:putative YhdH/YhfP family quinone oxidoreductase
MAFGTAGFTAARCVQALGRHGVTPGDGPILVTGVTGGVGGFALEFLLSQGHEVWALTTRVEAREELLQAGVTGFVDDQELPRNGTKLGRERWAGAVDAVGEATLPFILGTLRYGAIVAATGNVSGSHLKTTLLPFILRGVNLVGIDSAEVAAPERTAIWAHLAADLRPALARTRLTEVGLDDLSEALKSVLAGEARGRFIVRVSGA